MTRNDPEVSDGLTLCDAELQSFRQLGHPCHGFKRLVNRARPPGAGSTVGALPLGSLLVKETELRLGWIFGDFF